MLLPAILLASMLAPPQEPAPEQPAAEPAAQEEAAPQAAPGADDEVTSAPIPSAAADAAIAAGLKAFRRRNYRQAEIQFRTAMEADAQSAAAAFYLGYTYYKMAEPKRPFHPDKQKAAQLFAKAFELDPAFKPVWGTHTPKS
jgi:tetratricopeptide (TPR) repeat protein